MNPSKEVVRYKSIKDGLIEYILGRRPLISFYVLSSMSTYSYWPVQTPPIVFPFTIRRPLTDKDFLSSTVYPFILLVNLPFNTSVYNCCWFILSWRVYGLKYEDLMDLRDIRITLYIVLKTEKGTTKIVTYFWSTNTPMKKGNSSIEIRPIYVYVTWIQCFHDVKKNSPDCNRTVYRTLWNRMGEPLPVTTVDLLTHPDPNNPLPKTPSQPSTWLSLLSSK